MSTDVKESIPTIGYLFIAERLVMVDDHSITAIDGNLIKSYGHVWHKSFMKKGVVSHSGIDTDEDGGDTVIPKRDGFRIQTTSNIYNRRSYGTSNIKCNYYCC
jgi:hypothetical protein